MAHLTVYHPEIDGGRGRILSLEGDVVVLGRDPACGVLLDHRSVSRKHARLERGPDGWLLTDLGSGNGTFAGGQRVTGRRVEDGEELRLGDVRVVLSLADFPARRPPAPALPPRVPARRAPRPARRRSRAWVPVVAVVGLGVLGFGLFASWRLFQTLRMGGLGFGRSNAPAAVAAPPEAPDPAGTSGSAAGSEPEPQWPPPVEPGARQEVESAVTGVEGAFREGRLEAVSSVLHPVIGADYGRAFAAHQAELPRVADLLATRKLVLLTPGWAEYEVTEGGKTFRVTFEKVKGKWLLSSL